MQSSKQSGDPIRFDDSLQELKDLRSQLHFAADYCEMTFLKAKQKKMVMESTKEYICRAVITFIDHLGTVSSNLDSFICKNNTVPEAEIRIDCLKQRLSSCEEYSHKLASTKLPWSANHPRFHPRYVSPSIPNLEKSRGVRGSNLSDDRKPGNDRAFDMEEEVSLFLHTYDNKPSKQELGAMKREMSSVVPVQKSLSMLRKAQNPSFHFQSNNKVRRKMFTKKLHVLALIPRSKRRT